MGTQATQLRQELCQLIQEHVPSTFLGAFTDDPADPAVAQRFWELHADRGLLGIASGDIEVQRVPLSRAMLAAS